MVGAETFWDKTSARYAKSPVKDEDAYRQTLDRTRAYLSPSDSVLEIGCGTGTTALLLAGDVGHITASDISSTMIEIARTKQKAENVTNVEFLHATLTDGEMGDGPYDAVLAFNVLHLLEDAQKVFRRIHQLLRPGGLFISGTVCLREKGSVLSLVATILGKIGLVPYVRSFTISELEECITSEGFELVETDVFFPSPPRRFIVARNA